jgi:hypothetical protein
MWPLQRRMHCARLSSSTCMSCHTRKKLTEQEQHPPHTCTAHHHSEYVWPSDAALVTAVKKK